MQIVKLQIANWTWSVLVAVTLMSASGCGNRVADDFRRLAVAQTAEEERKIFDDLWHRKRQLGFVPRDALGRQVSTFDPNWLENVVTIDLECDGQTMSHRLIGKSNLWWLMRE